MAVSRTDESDPDAAGIEDPIDEEAAGWVARLSSSDATDADRAAFEAWRSADPAHAEAHAEMDALWRRLGRLPDPRPRPGPPKTLAGIAVALLLGGALAYQAGLVDRLRADLWSGVGSIEHATLADGSRVHLNTDTAIALHFSETERGVELLRGEAVFDVVPDPKRPFVVSHGGLSARAVGTRFVVRVDGADSPVGVAEGRVEVVAAGRHAMLSAGEAVRVGDDAALAVSAANVDRSTAWREGRLVFAGQSLATVLAELDRYRHGRIVLLDRRLGERRVTGVFDPRETDDALDVIAATMGVRIRRLSPLLVLVGSPL
ncbi:MULTISPECIES: FecR family protein [Methylobacterium]|uniref:Protein FecR n=1 Tax=Methylobacterium thuringiense TaxID=1003091 RepID=A0ABQ4TRF7_9HYPH|nr:MULTISPECIES: FecR family protein [Methylobacterium]TXN19661.1 FecR family protein [Methylobacterium sp. WL9]GJE56453.1 Protein FecR [Methylobacterium thuringiense]